MHACSCSGLNLAALWLSIQQLGVLLEIWVQEFSAMHFQDRRLCEALLSDMTGQMPHILLSSVVPVRVHCSAVIRRASPYAFQR